MSPRLPNPIGAHVPVGGGLARRSLPYADAVGAEVVQVFTSNPRGWAPWPARPDQDAAFATGCEQRRIACFVHAPYLVNLGSPDPGTVSRSSAAVRHALARAAAIGARGVVVHAGSSIKADYRDAAYKQVREQLLPILDGLGPAGPALLIEPTAGGGLALASRMESLGEYFAAMDHHPALRVCLDTCHVHAAGHDLAARGGVGRLLTAAVAAVGGGRIALVHANDSRDPAGSTRDRHAAVGSGTIGSAAFGRLLAHPLLRGVPFLVETDEAHQPADIAALKALRGSRR